jgi:hypothetical protein
MGRRPQVPTDRLEVMIPFTIPYVRDPSSCYWLLGDNTTT